MSVDDERDEFASLASDAYLLKNILAKSEPEKLKEIERTIITRLHRHENNPVANAFGQQLEELKERHSQGLMIGLEYLKHMLDLAWKVSEAEREVDPWEPPGQAKAKLTKLFNEVRGNDPPALVERIINNIYVGMRIVHFIGWQQTLDGERKVIKALRRILRKYNLHLEQELFDRIYEYLKQYY